MSPTTRRRNARYNLHWVLRDTQWIDGQRQCFVFDPNSRAGKKALARYFSDAGLGDYAHATAPRGYRRSLNHSADRREEQERHRWRKNPNHEVALPRRFSGASGDWSYFSSERKFMHHQRKRSKNARAGCLLCKPNKMNGWAKHRVLGHVGFGKLRREIAAQEILKEMK